MLRVSSRDVTYLFIVKQSQHPNIPFLRQWIQTVNQTLWVGTWVQWQVGIMVYDHGNIGTICPEILEVLKLGGLAPHECKKYWQNLNLAVVAHNIYIILIIAHVCIRKRSHSLTWSNPWVCKFTEKYNGQCAGTKPAISTAHVVGHQVGPRVPLHAFCHYVLWAKMILVNFNLAVSIPTPLKLPNLIPRQIFRLYGMWLWVW